MIGEIFYLLSLILTCNAFYRIIDSYLTRVANSSSKTFLLATVHRGSLAILVGISITHVIIYIVSLVQSVNFDYDPSISLASLRIYIARTIILFVVSLGILCMVFLIVNFRSLRVPSSASLPPKR